MTLTVQYPSIERYEVISLKYELHHMMNFKFLNSKFESNCVRYSIERSISRGELNYLWSQNSKLKVFT